MKLIPLTQGRLALVDDEDYERLSQFKWSFQARGYAWRAVGSMRRGNYRAVWMHREIANPRENQEVDHIDGNGLNNTRANLRLCTHAENLRNHKLNARNKTGFMGVSFDKNRRKFFASIRINGKTKSLGRFRTARLAAKARDDFAKKVWGPFASTTS